MDVLSSYEHDNGASAGIVLLLLLRIQQCQYSETLPVWIIWRDVFMGKQKIPMRVWTLSFFV